MRYLPLTEADRRSMLEAIGVPSVDELFRDVPEAARLSGPIEGLSNHMGELEVDRALSAMAGKNLPAGSVPSFLGAGAYRHHIPATVDHLVQRGEFLTAYTPYQPEVSQGTLQVLFEFQTQVSLLTGMDVANASMYDGATACAEAVMMANRVTRRKKAVLSGGLHPHYRDTTTTDARFIGFETVVMPPAPTGGEDLLAAVDGDTSCVVVQNPDVFGHVRDYTELGKACQAKGALLIVVVTEAVSLGLLTPPGAMGADIVAAEGQSLGNALNFGGPYVGLFAVKEKLVRQMPGRLCGQTVDADGRRGFVLTLSTREQHIRREKATSNICTNSGLCALAFSIHLSLLGEEGFTRLAEINHGKAVQLADKLAAVPGVEIVNGSFFNEFTVKLPKSAAEVVEALAQRGILGGVPASRLFGGGLDDLLIVATTETNTESDMDAFATALAEVL
ncbi:aminomethyl-transferring glycine dehydrogenase subunit GcvPA [Azospirillum brasilense]|uniref:Probable glycine dehydrogenase (decarboxylating) subunit 1 n=1 Tax=Azospirillum brasilense TaxID=192 RepID=A0ABU4P9M8_AZOBR|nr:MULTISPECIES: aminomethyl-transferring glycine dehydrogenase subunit GcvPA [Azospirillum]ALJ35622.1 glycine dehydrogenase [Azospirillum brasilense]MDW7554876.1 aminomethyl-transferring glycine dehydrogenase subunit GcvPA [Azospirillum brasilense]MDW7594653.1 aminomethyl-transferring glycine dehydrogenase subunit GcvPA [Azospirillum brasilense]MDW7629507.1 aminomethyl-transferring glycine dehydrogenase subunit GcvPA [Azospirillum brasilense]MDX5954367.1 aminomethyl-transferring glycine dehyd